MNEFNHLRKYLTFLILSIEHQANINKDNKKLFLKLVEISTRRYDPKDSSIGRASRNSSPLGKRSLQSS